MEREVRARGAVVRQLLGLTALATGAVIGLYGLFAMAYDPGYAYSWYEEPGPMHTYDQDPAGATSHL